MNETPEIRKPPYGNVTWYSKFFNLIRQRSFEKFDREIIGLNIIKGSNASILFSGLRFLGLIEEDGTTTDNFNNLRMIGDEFKQNLNKCVEEAYSDLFSKVAVESVKPEQLQNYFIENYNFGVATANRAMNIFKYLCQEAGIPLSQELGAKTIKSERKRIGTLKREEKVDGGKGAASAIPEGMHPIVWGDSIRIYLQKGDKSTRAKIADIVKKFLDIYVESGG